MYRTLFLYEQLKDHTGWSDYKLAQELEVSQSAIIHWKQKGSVMNDHAGQIAAKLLDIPEKTVLLSLAAERAIGDLSGRYVAEAADQAIAQADKKLKIPRGRTK